MPVIAHIDGADRDDAQMALGGNEARVEGWGDDEVSLTVIDTSYGSATLFLDVAGVSALSSALADAAKGLTPGMDDETFRDAESAAATQDEPAWVEEWRNAGWESTHGWRRALGPWAMRDWWEREHYGTGDIIWGAQEAIAEAERAWVWADRQEQVEGRDGTVDEAEMAESDGLG